MLNRWPALFLEGLLSIVCDTSMRVAVKVARNFTPLHQLLTG